MKRSVNYQKMWLSFALLMVTAMMVICLISYSAFNKRFTLEVEQAQQNAIKYENNTFNTLIIDAVNIMAQDLSVNGVYADSFKRLMSEANASNLNLFQAYNNLQDIKTINGDKLSWIGIHYPEQSFLISGSSGYILLNHRSNEAYDRFVSHLPQTQQSGGSWLYLQEHLLPNVDDRLAYCYTPLWHADKLALSPKIIFVVSERYVKNILESMITEQQSAFLLDSDGQILFSAGAASDYYLDDAIEKLLVNATSEAYTYSDRTQQAVHTICLVADTPFSLVISTPATVWYGETTDILHIVFSVGLTVLVVTLFFVGIISQRLYAPLQLLASAAQQAAQMDQRSRHDEYHTIQSALDELTHLLSSTQRVLHSNRQLLKNQALDALMQGEDSESAMGTLDYLELNFPHAYYQLMAVEYCVKDTQELSTEVRQALSVALPDVVENQFQDSICNVYGWLPHAHTIAFILNAPDQESLSSEKVSQIIESFFGCHNTRCYIVKSGIVIGSPLSLSQTYSRLNAMLTGRFYDLRDEKMHTSMVNGRETAAVQVLLDQIKTMGPNCYDGLIQCLNELMIQLSHLHPETAQVYFTQCMSHLRGLLLALHPDQALPAPLLEPYTWLWKITELSQILQLQLHSPSQTDQPTDDVLLMKRIKQYIQEHIAEDLSLNTLADALHFNPKYFSRKFRSIANMTLSNYITVQRMEAAALFLRRTDDSVEKIACSVGYNSSQYFIKKFKECYGITPSEFRKG